MQNITLRDFITKKSVTVVKLNFIMAFISGIKRISFLNADDIKVTPVSVF